MQVSLTVVGGVHHNRTIPIGVAEFRIGRDPKCHLRPASEDVSRQHCAIAMREGRVFLRDYGSRNGTILNRRLLVQGEVQLEDGDVIEVGPLTFRVGIAKEPATAAVAPSPGTASFTPRGESALDVSDDIHDVDLFSHEPTSEETIQVSHPNLPAPSVEQLKDAGPKIIHD
jgi:pSer/pThr/pTyr-binding forkhead associated (FHA) protein